MSRNEAGSGECDSLVLAGKAVFLLLAALPVRAEREIFFVTAGLSGANFDALLENIGQLGTRRLRELQFGGRGVAAGLARERGGDGGLETGLPRFPLPFFTVGCLKLNLLAQVIRVDLRLGLEINYWRRNSRLLHSNLRFMFRLHFLDDGWHFFNLFFEDFVLRCNSLGVIGSLLAEGIEV